MIIVSDASPLHYLVLIGHVEVLRSLFHEVVIPPAVLAELRHVRAPQQVRQWAESLPRWLLLRTPLAIDPSLKLDLGELEAIALAQELHAHALLIDERKGRLAAKQRHLETYGTLAVLENAGANGLLDLGPALDDLCATSFRVDRRLLAQIRARTQARKPPRRPQR